jgi:hypothetical protein
MVGVAASAAVAQLPGKAPDPYGFLIPQFGTRAVHWSQKQTATTRAKLEASPTFKSVLGDMQVLHAAERPLPMYWLLDGRRYIRFEHDKNHPYGIIAVAIAGSDGRPGAWRTVFDLDAYNRTVRTGRVVKGGFHIAPGRNSVAWIDRDTLLVAHTTEGAPVHLNQFPAELHLWRHGTPLARAPMIFRDDPKDSLFEFSVTGRLGRRRIFLNVARTYESFQLEELTPDERTGDLALPPGLSNFGTPQFSQGKVAVQLARAATIQGRRYPADAIVAYDMRTIPDLLRLSQDNAIRLLDRHDSERAMETPDPPGNIPTDYRAGHLEARNVRIRDDNGRARVAVDLLQHLIQGLHSKDESTRAPGSRIFRIADLRRRLDLEAVDCGPLARIDEHGCELRPEGAQYGDRNDRRVRHHHDPSLHYVDHHLAAVATNVELGADRDDYSAARRDPEWTMMIPGNGEECLAAQQIDVSLARVEADRDSRVAPERHRRAIGKSHRAILSDPRREDLCIAARAPAGNRARCHEAERESCNERAGGKCP